MDVGAMSYNTEYTIRADDLGRSAEERDFESVWFPEHTHIPASRETPFPGGGELPREYVHMSDPFVSCMAAAAVTKRLKVGTGISLVIEHDPIALAKTVATLDRLSDGRFLFGVGAGWNAEEMENHGTPFARRWKVLRERVEAMKALWTEEEASYHGEFVNFDRVWSYPKPVQKPHPPVILGTFGSEIGRQRVADYADGWIPIAAAFHQESMERDLADLRERLETNGRDPDAVSISIFCIHEPSFEELERYRDCGALRAIVRLPTEDRDRVIRALDRYAEMIPKLR